MTAAKRAAIYARVSTAEQASGGYSLDAQRDKGYQYAALKDWRVVRTYEDGGVSGAKGFAERPNGARLLDDAREGIFDVVIFTKLDRFARSVAKALADFKTFEDLGAEVVFIEEDVDTSTPQGRLFRTLLAAFAEFERDTIRDRSMAGRYAKALHGTGWAAGRVPFGYDVNEEGQLVVRDTEAEALRLAFRLRADGMPYRKVADRLNADGFAPREVRRERSADYARPRFTAGNVSHYIKNPIYRGDPLRRRIAPTSGTASTTFEFTVPAIVDPVTWERANRPRAGGSGRAPLRYALGGRVRHRHNISTAATMFGQTREAANRALRVYRCTAARAGRDGTPASCGGLGTVCGQNVTTVQADWVEAHALIFALDRITGTPQEGPAEWRRSLREAASRTIEGTDRDGHFEALPEWAIQEVAYLAEKLGIVVTVESSFDPRRPRVFIKADGDDGETLAVSSTPGDNFRFPYKPLDK